MSDQVQTGAQIIAQSLWNQGVRVVFGLVGFPVFETAQACVTLGMQFIGMRNEQAASYAASAYGYLEGKPAVLIVVPGPGVIHALAGMANSTENGWPLIVLGGSNPTYLHSYGGFQEMEQVRGVREYTKFAIRPPTIEELPRAIEKAYRISCSGRPGATFIDCPADFLHGKASVPSTHIDFRQPCPEPPRPLAHPTLIVNTVELLRNAKRPLLIIGKGAQYSRAEDAIRGLVDRLQIPFLPTPMGKGLVPDSHPANISPARTSALKRADVVLLLGGRLNWILGFGSPPKYANDVKFIQVDIEAEEIGNNVLPAVGIVGDIRAVVEQLNAAFDSQSGSSKKLSVDPWRQELKAVVDKNAKSLAAKSADIAPPLSYHAAFQAIKEELPKDHIFVSEGSNTMDIGRSFFEVEEPRSRLDAATYATMGVGMGFAIAAAVYHKKSGRRVVAVEGDSAFGFSGLEFETMARYDLPVTVIIINNNGIGSGIDDKQFAALDKTKLHPYVLSPQVRYEKVAEAVGCPAYYVKDVPGIKAALKESLASNRPSIINIAIIPQPKVAAAPAATWMVKPTLAKI